MGEDQVGHAALLLGLAFPCSRSYLFFDAHTLTQSPRRRGPPNDSMACLKRNFPSFSGKRRTRLYHSPSAARAVARHERALPIPSVCLGTCADFVQVDAASNPIHSHPSFIPHTSLIVRLHDLYCFGMACCVYVYFLIKFPTPMRIQPLS